MSTVWLLVVLSGVLAVSSGKRTEPTKPTPTAICINGTSLNISCPAGMVILKPEVQVGWLKDDNCTPSTKKDCRGTTPDILAQTNTCYWKEGCQIKLNPYMPMTSASNTECLAKIPTWAMLEKYECINASRLGFTCWENSSSTISNIYYKDGLHVLASHRNYPWHHPKGPLTCRTTIFPPKGLKKLMVRVEDIDLDPENVDNLTFNRISPKRNHSWPIRNGNLGFLVNMQKGEHLEIVFSVAGSSKSGRGFLIKFGSRKCEWKKNCKRGKKKKKLKKKKKPSKTKEKKPKTKRKRGRKGKNGKRQKTKTKRGRKGKNGKWHKNAQ